MLNHIWAFLIVVGVLAGFASAVYKMETGENVTKTVDGKTVTEFVRYDTMEKKVKSFSDAGTRITKAAFNSVAIRYTDDTGKERQGAVGIALDFIGIMALWLGMMKIADASGLIKLLARAIEPVFRFVFPSVPPGHPAAGAMLMNIAANMLGLDNAATPLGLKAMQELQKLNGEKETASNAMCMFLAINVSSICFLPASIIGYRVAFKSANPTSFLVPMLIATALAQTFTITTCKIIEKFRPDTKPADPEPATEAQQ